MLTRAISDHNELQKNIVLNPKDGHSFFYIYVEIRKYMTEM